MAYNLFIAYDLDKPGQNYEQVRARIRALGPSYHAQQSLFYVHTSMSPQSAHSFIFEVMDANDKLMVVDATHAVMFPAPPDIVSAINHVWFEPV